MGYKGFIIFYALLLETFIELMIKAMDMEIIDWTEIDSWKAGKLTIMAVILIYHSFFRWVPFIAVRKSERKSPDLFISSLISSHIPWFLFANIFHAILMTTFGLLCWKMNVASWPLYSLLFVGAIEIVVYLMVGIFGKLFTIIMGKNSIIISSGYLTSIQLKEVKKIEKKYNDELYFTMSDGTVNTVSYHILNKKTMTEFLVKLKNNCDTHNIYFGNDVLDAEGNQIQK
jgi:hypothetical protein